MNQMSNFKVQISNKIKMTKKELFAFGHLSLN